MSPAPTAQHGTPAYWSRRYAEGGDYAPLTDEERELFASLPRPEGAQALDLCCGTGGVARHLASLGYQVLGVDFSEAGLARAREQTAPGATVDYRCVDFNQEPGLVTPHSQHLVVCRLGAAFLDGPLLVDRVVHWLAPHGVFAVVLPDPRHLDPRRRSIYLDESQISDLTRGFGHVERHYTEHLLVLLLSDWAPSHRFAEKRLPAPNACLGVGIVVQDPATGRVLLGRSARFDDMLEAPGGKPETSGTLVEDLRHTAARELREETGLVADPADVQLRSVLIDRRGVPRVTVAAYLTRFEGTPRAMEPELIEGWDWYALDAPLPGALFTPSLDCLGAVFPDRFHGRPTRHYPLDRALYEQPAARTAFVPPATVTVQPTTAPAPVQPRVPAQAAPGHALPHHARAARTLRLAVAQSTVPEDPSDPELLRAAGEQLRRQMREAAAAGARLVQFPEGALVYPDPRGMPTDPSSRTGHVDWAATRWDVLREEEEAIRTLAGELGLWTAFGTIRRVESAPRPRNSLLVVSDQGEVAACYDKRILSHTERSRLYSPGTDPVVFEIDGWRFGIALCIEVNFHELFAQYEAMDVDCVLLSVMADDALRAGLAKSYGTLFNFWLGYSVPAQYGATAPAGIIGPGGPWLTRCPAENRPAVTVTDLDLDTTNPIITTALTLARPWRRHTRAQDLDTGLLG